MSPLDLQKRRTGGGYPNEMPWKWLYIGCTSTISPRRVLAFSNSSSRRDWKALISDIFVRRDKTVSLLDMCGRTSRSKFPAFGGRGSLLEVLNC